MTNASDVGQLIWWPELGMGKHTAPPISYDSDYWAEYEKRDATDMGAKLTAARVALVTRHTAPDTVIDIGIGAGAFVKAANCMGFDVNSKANAWLGGRYANPYYGCEAVTCWDSLEHIPEPEKLINSVRSFVFVSLPVFESAESVLTSRHYKPGEHIWYWTRDGFVRWMDRQCFELIEQNAQESVIGRHKIGSFAFRRRE